MPADENVRADAAVQAVVIVVADEDVVAALAAEHVGPRPSVEQIVAGTALKYVFTVVAEQHVVATVGEDPGLIEPPVPTRNISAASVPVSPVRNVEVGGGPPSHSPPASRTFARG